MKVLIASDIHGSAHDCEQMRDAFLRENADRMILLGDILYHGPRNDLPPSYAPPSVIAMLNPLADQILCVRGNCDAEVDQMVLDFPIMADYAWLTLDGLTLFLTHGHHYNPHHPPKLRAGALLLNGHTHIPDFQAYDDFFYINPGSVSIPKANSVRSYIIYENRTFVWKSLDGMPYRQEHL